MDGGGRLRRPKLSAIKGSSAPGRRTTCTKAFHNLTVSELTKKFNSVKAPESSSTFSQKTTKSRHHKLDKSS